MKVLLVTDTWQPQVNGVVRTYHQLQAVAKKKNIEILPITPYQYRSVPCPTYPEIRLALTSPKSIETEIRKHNPDYIHLATEGPLGISALIACSRLGIPFTTSYHTRFPEYLAMRNLLPRSLVYTGQKYFHNSSIGTMIRSSHLSAQLVERGFRKLLPWAGGVDASLFHPRKTRIFGIRGPVFLYVGRLSIEKNIEAFLDLRLPGMKVVVGHGPHATKLQMRYRDVTFCGLKLGATLAQLYASADVFVFPSRTDTFGLTILEAMASGVPVAAYPVPGPLDLVISGVTGFLHEDLESACLAALELDRRCARDYAEEYSWEHAADSFIKNILSANRLRHRGRRLQ
jgi:glycosyltransferase involved in cell wall biosynthesis